jgi:tRNA dimethylallyltransferase
MTSDNRKLPRVLVVVGGPTASGKTHVAASLAARFATEVISADSRQFYRDLRIGTARPPEHELLGVKHHFLGHLGLEESWSAGAFARAVEPVLQGLLQQKGIAIMAGGSGLYIDAVINGLDPLPVTDVRLRQKLVDRFRDHGLPPLLDELQRLDPMTWEKLDRRNPHRVIRALEICMITGRPGSAHRTGPQQRTDMTILRLAMELPRKELYERIDTRVDAMVRAGLVEEARAMLPFRDRNALRTVGYRELFEHFDGNISLFQAIDLVKQHTRNYAKRQMTWLRRDPSWKWVHPGKIEEMAALMKETLAA